MEDKPEVKQSVEISIYKGDKLFNENTPFAVNLFAHESKDQDKQRVSADLICVIDISGSMMGEKMILVRESLKILVDMMDPKDRIALILFSSNAKLYYDLNYLTEENKEKLKELINQINASGGTNIASGLQVAVDILKKEKNETKTDEGRSSSVLLLSDGCDNYLNDVQLGEKLKSYTKGAGLSFTLNTFGYGYDHSPKIMNRLANLRDGSFFLVEDYNKVGEYFVAVLGGCITTISKNAELNIKLLNNDCKILKLFGKNDLYSYELKDNLFTNKFLQFIKGKEYTHVFEIKIDESKIKPGDDLLEVSFKYEDINDKTTKTITSIYKYEITDLNFAKANEEYIRSHVYDVLEEAVKLRENYKYEEGKKMLKDLKEWIKNNYKGNNKDYLNDIEKSEKMFAMNDMYANRNITYVTSQVRQMQSKRMGSNNIHLNFCQQALQNNYQMNFARSQKAAPNQFNMQIGQQAPPNPLYQPNLQFMQIYQQAPPNPLFQPNLQFMQNSQQAPPPLVQPNLHNIQIGQQAPPPLVQPNLHNMQIGQQAPPNPLGQPFNQQSNHANQH